MTVPLSLSYIACAAGIAGGLVLDSVGLLGTSVIAAVFLGLAVSVDFEDLSAWFGGGGLQMKRLPPDVNPQIDEISHTEKRRPTIETKGPTTTDEADPDDSFELWTRDGIEKLMAIMADWGWTMGRLGMFGDSPPEPVVEWTRDGSPHVVYGQARVSGGGEVKADGSVDRPTDDPQRV